MNSPKVLTTVLQHNEKSLNKSSITPHQFYATHSMVPSINSRKDHAK